MKIKLAEDDYKPEKGDVLIVEEENGECFFVEVFGSNGWVRLGMVDVCELYDGFKKNIKKTLAKHDLKVKKIRVTKDVFDKLYCQDWSGYCDDIDWSGYCDDL